MIYNPNTNENLVPPQSIEAEACMLGAMLLDADAVIPTVRRILQPEDFYRPAHEDLCRLIFGMADARIPVDLVTLRNEMERTGTRQKIGGIEYAVTLAEGVPSTANAEHYANIVRDKSLLRRAIQAARKVEREAYSPAENAAETLGRAQQAFYDLARPADAENEANLGPEVREKLAGMERELEHGRPSERRFDSGFPEIDTAIHGLRGGRMVTLAAKTKAGKSTLAMNMALNVAMRGGPVLYVSGEMRPDELAERFLSMSAPIQGEAVKNPRTLRVDDWERLRKTGEMFDGIPMRLIGRSLSLSEIGMKARETGTMFGRPTALVVVDYLAIMRLPAARELRVSVGEFTRGLKQLAMELDACVLLVSQLRRMTDENSKPSLHDLKESGDIENDSDAVLLINTPHPLKQIASGGICAFESWVRVAACRDGVSTPWPKDGEESLGAIRLRWQPWYMRFLPW